MAELTMRAIEWIDNAPVKIEAKAETTASPDAVFDVLADHDRWPEWFPSVKKVTVLGKGEGVGARRRVVVPGMTVDEEFIVWQPGKRWSFTGYEAKPGVAKSLIEDCVLTPLANGGTAISYTMYIEPKGFAGVMLKLIKGQLVKNNTKAMQALAKRAAE